MIGKASLAAAAVSLGLGFSSQPAWSQQVTGVKAGILTCDVASGWGFVFGSTRDLKCSYTDNNGTVEQYTGHIDKLGVDIGYHASGVIAWAVLAPTANVAEGALAGSLALGVGASAHALVGSDSGQTISLQPLSIEGMTGVEAVAGIAQIVLSRPSV